MSSNVTVVFPPLRAFVMSFIKRFEFDKEFGVWHLAEKQDSLSSQSVDDEDNAPSRFDDHNGALHQFM